MPDDESSEQEYQLSLSDTEVQKIPVIDLDPQKIIKRFEDQPGAEKHGEDSDSGQSR